jgi:hypothetical protein
MTEKDIRSILENKAVTPSTRQPWQDFLDRNPSVPASKSLEATPALEGFAGSWAASYANGIGSQSGVGSPVAANTPVRVNKLGQPGLPEINFVPYCYGTNRFGVKGPSLIGHPISFSIVGPTLKSPYTLWQWIVTDNSATPGTGDTLEIDATDSVLSPLPPAVTTVSEAYGISSPVANYNGGLYLVISQTGFDGSLDGGSIGGLGDGFVAPGANNAPLEALDETSKFEIFRIVDITGGIITLDPAKRLAAYFTFPGGGDTPVIRGVTILQPKASRLVAVPGSGPATGRERVFVAVPPETGANSDLLPPYGDIITANTWLGGGVDPWDPNSVTTGLAGSYNEDVPLPVPVPLETRTARAESNVPPNAGVVPALGYLNLVDLSGNISADDVGRIIRVFRAETQGTVVFPVSPYDGSPGVTPEDFFGWYEIDSVDLITSRYTLRRIAEVDPNSGRLSYGLGSAYIVDISSSADAQVTFTFTLHNPISSLFSGGFDADKVSASRLTNLIDPSLVERSAKTPGLIPGISAARPDRAVFDTSVSAGGDFANPGSLLDLGFRMVLFPAQDVGGALVPNFDRPIDSREVVLDPTITDESQYVSVDYSAGTVILSHAPDPGTGCDVAPDGVILTPENPRGELVLFASFVPYSMEEGQKGASIRVTGAVPPVSPLATYTQVDVFSERVSVSVQPGQTVTSGSGYGQTLDLEDDGGVLPQTGFFELIEGGRDSTGDPAFLHSGQRSSTFGYIFKTTEPGPITRLHGVYGGGATGTTISTGASVGEYVVVLRRDVLPTQIGFPTVDYQQDSTYGSAKRSSTVRFLHADIAPQADGSVTVDFNLPGASPVLARLFRSWVLSDGIVTGTAVALNDNYIDVTETVVLFRGRRYVLDAGTLGPFPNAALTSTDYYVYADSTSNLAYATVNTLPLPEEDDILIAKVTVPSVGSFSAGPLDVIDLRSILAKVDKRWDIVVGTFPNGWTGYNVPHFETLGEAVAYASEIMSPTGTGSDSGPQITIKVLGGTVETQPIQVRADGIVIEGATRAEGVSGDDTTMAIKWAFDGPLFLLNGHSDLVFRDLYFYYNNAAPSAFAFPTRYVFFNQTETCERLVIDNCTATGTLLEGFLYSSYSGVLPATRVVLSDAHITRNHVTASDFGIYLDDGSESVNCHIENNRILSTGLPVTSIEGVGLRLSPTDPAATTNVANHFRGNFIGSLSGTGFRYGIVAYGREDIVTENYISDTEREGVITVCAGDRPIISNNHLINVHVGGNPIWKPSTDVAAPGFTIPAVGATVNIPVVDTAATSPAMYVGQVIYVTGGGGYFIITAVAPTTQITARNLGYAENAAPGTVIAAGTGISYTFAKEGIFATNTNGSGVNHGIFVESNFITISNSTFVQSDLGVHVISNDSKATIRNNRMDNGSGVANSGIRVASEYSWVDGNFGLLLTPTSNSRVTKNIALALVDDNASVVNTLVANNYLELGVYGEDATDPFDGSYMIFAENEVTSGNDILVSGTGNLFRHNVVGGEIVITGASNKFFGNTISGNLTAASGTHEVVGNTVGGDLSAGASSTITDNRITGHIYVGSSSRIANNQVTGSIRTTAAVTGVQVMNNRATSIIGTGASGTGGNFEGSTSFFTSNTLSGDLNLEGTDNQIHSNILTGHISHGIGCILVGNICNTIRNVLAPGTTTQPTNSIAVGNRFGIAPNQIWGSNNHNNDHNAQT